MKKTNQTIIYFLICICSLVNGMETDDQLLNYVMYDNNSLNNKSQHINKCLEILSKEIEKKKAIYTELLYIREYLKKNNLEKYNTKNFLDFLRRSLDQTTAKPSRYIPANRISNLATLAYFSSLSLSPDGKKQFTEQIEVLDELYRQEHWFERTKKLIDAIEVKQHRELIVMCTLMTAALFIITNFF